MTSPDSARRSVIVFYTGASGRRSCGKAALASTLKLANRTPKRGEPELSAGSRWRERDRIEAQLQCAPRLDRLPLREQLAALLSDPGEIAFRKLFRHGQAVLLAKCSEVLVELLGFRNLAT